MSSGDEDFDDDFEEPSDEDLDESSDATFPGDRGTLAMPTRRALVQLLAGPSIDGSRQAKLWETVLKDEAALRSQLHNLFLDLVLDHDHKVAFTRKVVADGLELPTLLRKQNLTYLESALVLFLRQRLTQSEAQGERAVISHQEMAEHLSVYERDKNVDHSRFERQVDGAIEKAKKLSLLRKLRGADDRYEVSPTLRILFTAEDVSALARAYKGLIAKPEVTPEAASDDTPPSAEDFNSEPEQPHERA
jgi:hypothetical protein